MTTTIASQNVAGVTTYDWTGSANGSASTMSLDGVVQMTNMRKDPAPGTGVTWGSNQLASGSVLAVPDMPSGRAYVGTFAAGNSGSFYVVDNDRVVIVGGQTYSYSIYGRHSWAGQKSHLTLQYFDANGNAINYVANGDDIVIPANQIVRQTFTHQAPANATGVALFWDCSNAFGVHPTATDSVQVSSMEQTATPTLVDYFDGNTSDVTRFPVIIPDLVVGYSVAYATKNVLHQAIGNRSSTATVNGAGLRTGGMTLLFATEAQKTAAVAVLTSPAVFDLSSTDLASIDMSFVVAGSVVETLDPETQQAWTVAFDLEEIA